MTPTSPLLLDACVVLSLYATRRMEEILRANQGSFLVAEAVLRESLYVHVVVEGVREKEPVLLDPHVSDGLLEIVEPRSESEFASLFELSLKLDDGEAMSCAIALHRGFRIATDDGKTIRLLGPRVPIVGTLDLVRHWADATAAPVIHVRDVLLGIADRGYIPGATHIHRSWWDQLLGNT